MTSFHWLRAFLILLTTCVFVLAFSSSASAESHGKGHKCNMPEYSEIDTNADGSVTSEEFYAFRANRMAERAKAGGKLKNAKNAPSFEDLDLDGDGDLSADEFAEHHKSCPMHKGKDGEGEKGPHRHGA